LGSFYVLAGYSDGGSAICSLAAASSVLGRDFLSFYNDNAAPLFSRSSRMRDQFAEILPFFFFHIPRFEIGDDSFLSVLDPPFFFFCL